MHRRECDPISFVCSCILQHHFKTNMILAGSLNTLDHQREATRDSCRNGNYPSGNVWLSTQLGELPAENTGLGEFLLGLWQLLFSVISVSPTTHVYLIMIYKLVVVCLLLQKHIHDNLIIDYIEEVLYC